MKGGGVDAGLSYYEGLGKRGGEEVGGIGRHGLHAYPTGCGP